MYLGEERVFSGVQPTGNLHLGNYLGAIKKFVSLQDEYNPIYCIVDMHSITVWQDPGALREQTREIAAAYIASGVDPERSIIFNQSAVPAHTQLAWIFNCVARCGWLNRMTQFKDKAGKKKDSASAGLYSYPCLMAADILAYKATHVPVGEDQHQHLELTRDIARKFNADFSVGDFFPMPMPIEKSSVERVMSLRDGLSKMSKSDVSDFSRINLSDDEDLIAVKIMKAKTDSKPLPSELKDLVDRPEASNLVGIFSALTNQSMDQVLHEYGSRNFSTFKKELIGVLLQEIIPISKELHRLKQDVSYLESVLDDGAIQARSISTPIVNEVMSIVGLSPRM